MLCDPWELQGVENIPTEFNLETMLENASKELLVKSIARFSKRRGSAKASIITWLAKQGPNSNRDAENRTCLCIGSI